ncbi:hypothetical protein PFISCL1PPCAC_19107, partial [Pristionchus fissidentatus]
TSDSSLSGCLWSSSGGSSPCCSSSLISSKDSLSILACSQRLVVGVVSVGDSTSRGRFGAACSGGSARCRWLGARSRGFGAGASWRRSSGRALHATLAAWRLLLFTLILILLLLLSSTTSHNLHYDSTADESRPQNLKDDVVHNSVARIVHTIYDVDVRQQCGARVDHLRLSTTLDGRIKCE